MIANKIRHLLCCCCGERHEGRQFHNQDTGFGLCPKCADWIADRGMDHEEMQRTYGQRGVHYDIQGITA